MINTLPFIITVIGGSLTFSISQFILKACFDPAIDLKRQIGKIAYDLDFYGNQMYGNNAPLGDEARTAFRKHACELRAILNAIIWYEILKKLFNLPDKSDVVEASFQLIGHSNFPKQHDPLIDSTRDQEIKKLLRIEI